MALLPSFFILQSGSKYLSLTENVPPGLPTGFVKFDEEQIWSPRVKFAAEPAETGDGRFVHIRSLYNNKYLVKKQIDDETNKSWIIVASAKKPEEDASKDSCTLFEPHSEAADDQPTSVRLRHVVMDDEKNHKCVDVTLSLASSSMLLALAEASSSNNSGSVFSVIDRESLVVLPSRVAFKWNDRYLRAYDKDWQNYERFEYVDITDACVFKVLFPTADGNYRIRDSHRGHFFKYHTTWIYADGGESETSDVTKFCFVHVSNNDFGVRSLGDNCYCGPLTADGKTDCLNARYHELSDQTILTVEERVREREIVDIEYRPSDARIYGEQPIEVDTQVTYNYSSVPVSVELQFTKTNSITRSWSNSQTISFGVKVSFKVAEIPFIDEETIEFNTDLTTTHQWGETETNETSRGTTNTVTVPPKMTIKVTLTATMGRCDVPNYTQRDLFYGVSDWVETRKYDGIFSGVNSYNFDYKIEDI